MKLRKLEVKDAPLMLEWMHDKLVVKNLKANFEKKTIEDCRKFILAAEDSTHDLHLAIVDDNDIYMGTVSLKHIKDNLAEFAITVRRKAMGQGFSEYGMSEIIRIGLEEMGLNQIYWCVCPDNYRALHFYNKNGYHQFELIDEHIEGYTSEEIKNYLWYKVGKK